MSTFYNEIDPFAANWLRQLRRKYLITLGFVQEKSIADIAPKEIKDYTRAHFFAGIGGWDLALQLAGWPEEAPVWTGSCPCQPFSVAGKRAGTADERHLWPQFARLIKASRPPVIFGEQVASADGRLWLDGVRSDLESMGYEVGAADLCAAGVNAPHIRQRLYWMAYAKLIGRGGRQSATQEHILNGPTTGRKESSDGAQYHRKTGRLAPAAKPGWKGREFRPGQVGASADAPERLQQSQRHGTAHRLGDAQRQRDLRECGNGDGSKGSLQGSRRADTGAHEAGHPSSVSGLGNTNGTRRIKHGGAVAISAEQPSVKLRGNTHAGLEHAQGLGRGQGWGNYDIAPCADGKTRRIESGTFPLVNGFPGRVGLLRGYGNAIVPQVAAEFVKTCMEFLGGL